MSENQQDTQKPLEEVLNPVIFDRAIKDLAATRTVSADDVVSFKPVEATSDEVRYVLTAEDIPLKDIIKHGQSSCRDCNGKGHYITHLEKSRVSNPQDYVILSDRPLDEMTPEEKNLWVEMQKKVKLWKIMLPCRCALRKIAKFDRNVVSNETGNIVFKIKYQIKED